MMRHGCLAAAAVAGVCLAAAPAASADDAGVFHAYTARQASEVDPAGKAYLRAVRRARRTGTRRAYRRIIRADRRINRALTRIERDLETQAPSSDPGARARTNALREVRGWRRANRIEIGSVRAFMNGHRALADRRLARANRTMYRAIRHGRRAVRRFRAAGFSSPVGSIS